MNKKVLKTMITLVIALLLGFYVLKIFFPEQFVMSITNEHIVAFGKFVDEHLWIHIILGTITSFITYWLYTCACYKKTRLGWKACLSILCICISIQIIYYFIDSTVFTPLSTALMLIVPAFIGADGKHIAVVFSIHGMSQWLSTRIRNLPFMLTNINYATIFLMGIESYFWLLLCYFYNNYKEGGNK